MTLVEISVKPRSSNSSRTARSKDGMCGTVMPPGILIPPVAYDLWIRNNVPPLGWASLDRASQTRVAEYRQRVHDVVVARTRRQPSLQESYDRCMSFGLDTSWAFKDLLEFGILRCDLTRAEIDHLTTPKYVDGNPDMPTLEKRLTRIPYELIVSSGTRDEWRDDTRRIVVNRLATPMTFADLQTQDY